MKKYHIIGLAVILILIVIVLVLWASSDAGSNPSPSETAISIDEGWQCNWEGSKDSEIIRVPGLVKGGYAGRYLHISNKLTTMSFDNPCLFLRTSEQNLKVYLNGNEIYEYVRQDADRSPGSMYHFISLPDSYQGGKLDIYLMSPLVQYSGVVNVIRVGSSISHMSYVLHNNGFQLVIATTVGFAGLIMFFFFIAMLFAGSKHPNVLYLGLYIIFSGLWMATESRCLELIIQNPRLILSLAFIGQYLAPVPLLAFIIKTYKIKRNKPLIGFMCVFPAYFTITSVLYLLHKVEYINTLVIFHILLGACIAVVGVVSVREIKSGNKSIRLFFAGLMILCASVIADMIIFYFSSTPWLSANSFYQPGILVFILITIGSLTQHMFVSRDEQISREILMSLAFTDPLTGLKNRTSFDERMNAVNSNLDPYSSIHLIIMDINGLKTVNDNFGHREGDRLIIDGARLINETLGRLGELFRIGGDEFALIITDVEQYFIHVEIESLNKKIAAYNETQHLFQISIAYGTDMFVKGQDRDLHSVFVRADKAMYICKENQKGIQKK